MGYPLLKFYVAQIGVSNNNSSMEIHQSTDTTPLDFTCKGSIIISCQIKDKFSISIIYN